MYQSLVIVSNIQNISLIMALSIYLQQRGRSDSKCGGVSVFYASSHAPTEPAKRSTKRNTKSSSSKHNPNYDSRVTGDREQSFSAPHCCIDCITCVEHYS